MILTEIYSLSWSIDSLEGRKLIHKDDTLKIQKILSNTEGRMVEMGRVVYTNDRKNKTPISERVMACSNALYTHYTTLDFV